LKCRRGDEKIRMKPARKLIDPEEDILSALSPEDRLDTAFRIVREAFKGTKLTMRDINRAVELVRRKAYERNKVVIDTKTLFG